ncbi:hypothetical protein IAT38_007063 [Cryptococcus sp. DSM 104549]
MTPRILVIGAGELGLALISSLTAHPSKPSVTVLLRPNSSSIPSLSPYPVSILHGDTSSPVDTLADLFRGFDIVISAAGFASGPGSQLRLAQAALAAGVGHYLPWQFGVDYDTIGRGSSQPLFDEQLDVRDLLRTQSATKWTIVSTGLFTSFLFDKAFGVVQLPETGREAVVTALGGWEGSVTVTSAESIGRYTAAVLLDGPTIPEGVVFVADDTVTFSTVADEVSRAGWEITRKVLSIEELQKRREADPEDVGPKYQLIWARNKGVSWAVEGTWNEKKGLKGQRLSEWVDANLPKP